MSLARVKSWRDALRHADATEFDTGLSAEGARAAWSAALDALGDHALESALARRGKPYRTAAFIAARTVFSAPLEWCAVLLARGTSVTLKLPSGALGAGPAMAEAARSAGLPLTWTQDRAVNAELVVAMGSDETMAHLTDQLPASTVLDPHGHHFSVAWVTGQSTVDPVVPEGFRDAWGAVAADTALHDGRGCLSPVAVFTPLPLEQAGPALADAMRRAEQRWPVGDVGCGEWGLARSRAALAQVTGEVYRAGRGSVHALPLRFFEPAVLPRHVALFHAPDVETMVATLRPWAQWLSTIGSDAPKATSALLELGAVRVCGLGRMQRPDLVRLHDGRDWVATTLRP
ncbi:MAG: hypothetical protein KC912_04115 [Proteobacteria bacterium]|nr:hypothetical protein [Pseudomonadota bacterium]